MENYESQAYQQPTNDNGNFLVSKLPNSTAVLILGIVSILGCCCYGIVGLICGIIGIVLAKKDMTLYKQNPKQYIGIETTNTGRILCIIGIILSAIYILLIIISLIYFGSFAAIQEYQQQWIQEMQQAQ